MYSTTVCNKQIFCWQLQNHVWIQNFRRSNWKITMFGKSVHLFKVLRYGGSCKEMCATILWVSKQDDSTTLHSTNFKEEEFKSVGELPKVYSQIVLKCLYLARIGRLDILWSVNKLAHAVTKWTKACDKRSACVISYIHHTCEYRQYCYVGNPAQHCRWVLFRDSDFARDLEDSKFTSGGTLCIFGSHTFVPISWMCKKQTSVSHSSTESEIITLDAGLRLDGIPALDWWNLIVGEKDAGAKRRRKKCGKIEIYSDELVFSCSDKSLIREKSDCVQKSADTHSSGKTRMQDERKLKIRRSVEFSSATARCIPWRVDGHSHGETCHYKRGIRGSGPFRIWNWEWRRCNMETGCLWNSNGETQCTQSISLPWKTKSWKDTTVTQSARVSSHKSQYGSSVLDRQGDPRTRTRWPYEWFESDYGHLGQISECHSSSSGSSWTRLWGEFTIREE